LTKDEHDDPKQFIAAAPRTQGSELARAEEAEKIASNGLDEIRRLTEEVVRLKEAQPQPTPRAPVCLWCEQGNKPVHRLQDGRWLQPCTAIPAQNSDFYTAMKERLQSWQTDIVHVSVVLKLMEELAPAATDEEKGSKQQ
jgi:hypothetical protein